MKKKERKIADLPEISGRSLKEKIVELIRENYLHGNAPACADKILELFKQKHEN
jgi:hypothetical protein